MKRKISAWQKTKFIIFLIMLNVYILICWSIAYTITLPLSMVWNDAAPV
jgi:hypothetical protein